MAAITIERGLNQQSATQTAPLIGFNYQQGIWATTTLNSGEYLRANIELSIRIGVSTSSIYQGEFEMTYLNGSGAYGVIGHFLDLTEIIRSLKLRYTAPFYSLSEFIKVTVIKYNSSGVIVESSNYIDADGYDYQVLTFAKPRVGAGLYDLFNLGRTSTIYHNGSYSYFSNDSKQHRARERYDIITGSTFTGIEPYTGTNVVYVPLVGEEIKWIDRDGAWSFWNFKLIGETFEVKKSNEVVNYALSNFELASKTMMLDSELKSILNFTTVAYNSEHFKQLTEIAISDVVIYNNKLYTVKDSNKTSALCKQNLRFNLTLEIEENG